MDYDTRPPLTRHIMEEPVLSRLRLPQLDLYDGTTNPFDHLESYKALMQVQGATDALLCIAFSATLRKVAHAWYSRLPSRSIDSFQQLKKTFLAYFDACRKIFWVADSLFFVRQKEGESLKDFMARFKTVALEVYHLDDAMATLALKRGLRLSRFTYSLDKRLSSSYAELLSCMQKYIHADEVDFTRREAEEKPIKNPVRAEPSGPTSKKPNPARQTNNQCLNFTPREDNLTPLLALRSHILMEIESESYFRCSPSLKKDATWDRSHYCHFY